MRQVGTHLKLAWLGQAGLICPCLRSSDREVTTSPEDIQACRSIGRCAHKDVRSEGNIQFKGNSRCHHHVHGGIAQRVKGRCGVNFAQCNPVDCDRRGIICRIICWQHSTLALKCKTPFLRPQYWTQLEGGQWLRRGAPHPCGAAGLHRSCHPVQLGGTSWPQVPTVALCVAVPQLQGTVQGTAQCLAVLAHCKLRQLAVAQLLAPLRQAYPRAGATHLAFRSSGTPGHLPPASAAASTCRVAPPR
mmetsp:Transcript_19949/g.59272  ORF Transcript_19949/g.59272 Transcript_19949/m.59272 type:complete len:246 (+) Transcript_19949:247-984(+)